MSITPPRVLVFTRTTAYRHDSIPDGVAALTRLGAEHGFTVEAGETTLDPDGCAAVVFLSTSGDILTPESRDTLRAYVAAGGGFVGIHSAACTEYGWPAYGDLLGARFAGHPELQPGLITVEDHDHPATAHLGATWRLTDEWYDFRANPRGSVRVLASADESSYDGGSMGGDHPLVWCREYGEGRSFYTALGHTAEIYRDPDFCRHLLGGIAYAARLPG
ncbi:ThuA domain-containing protein [Streptosporangium sp. KLBMP 9127]|nr:ThuA domain-containing protein [Streptosporangium sp. KLBMP 9127]